MLIYDKEQIHKFINYIYPDLEKDEAFFISLSSRTKYLTKEQKERGYVTNRNEMFHRSFFNGNKELLYSKVIDYIQTLNIEEDITNGEDQLTDFNISSGHNIPLNTVTVYVNINPSNVRQAAANLAADIVSNLLSNDSEYFFHIRSKMNTQVQKTRSRRCLIDIDFDVDEEAPVKWFIEECKKNNVDYYVIKTHSGYHVLLKKDTLSGFNLQGSVEEAKERFHNSKEIVINKNAMVPFPGTYQGGVPVVLYENF